MWMKVRNEQAAKHGVRWAKRSSQERDKTAETEERMQERILVPLDGSRVSESVLPYVEDLMSKLSPGTKVEVTLL